jgi:hypothetical protein
MKFQPRFIWPSLFACALLLFNPTRARTAPVFPLTADSVSFGEGPRITFANISGADF